jgi:2-polyprenyl-3-methyl-5-hydroxy-6-metoxy-1,4-benzoquinol methylase
MGKPKDYHEVKYELIERMNILLLPMRYKVMLNELRHLEKGRLLDIGCGEGVLLENAKRQGFDVTGIDFSEQAVELCHQKNLDAICLDIEGEELPFNEEFDIVIAVEIIEHLYDYYRFLASANNCLRQNGLLFLTTPNSAWLFAESSTY